MSNAKPFDESRAERTPPLDSQDFINPGSLREIRLDRLTSGLKYQRTVNEKTVQKLVDNWNPRYLEPIAVSYRDDKYYVIDGQHRVAAMRRLKKRGMLDADVKVLCIVHTGLTYKEEAELFCRLDQCRKKLSSSQSINALLQSGADAELNDIQQTLEARGFLWSLDGGMPGNYKIRATRAVIYAYRLLGRDAFPRMLALLSDTWRGDPSSLSAMMLSGLALFLKTYETRIDDHTFITRFANIAPETITRKAKTDLSTNRNDLRCARSLLVNYNKFVRKGNKLNSNILW